ncbi:hypothetical protein TWF281_003718 [Arthrobotrys megalospora]
MSGWGKRKSKYSFDFTHTNQVPHPPPTFEHAQAHVNVELGSGSKPCIIRVSEGVLSKWPYFRSRLAALRYGAPTGSTVTLKFEDISPDGGTEVINYLHGKSIIECMDVPSTHNLEVRVAQMWEAATKWQITTLKTEILSTTSDLVHEKRITKPKDFIQMMTRIYALAGSSDQDTISDIINVAVKTIPVHRWWDGIRLEKTNSFYHRLAGIVFRDLTGIFCRNCALTGFGIDRPTCVNCGCNIRR